VVLCIEKIDREEWVITFRKAADLKGKDPQTHYRHALANGQIAKRDLQGILKWAQPGRTALCFHNGERGFICLGNFWYQCVPSEKPLVWQPGFLAERFALTYLGSVDALCKHIQAICDGHEVVITALAPDNRDYGVQQSVGRDWALGDKGRVRRIRASLKIEGSVLDDPALFVGWGIGGPEVLPALITALKSQDSQERAEAAEDLGQLGALARTARPKLKVALHDPDVHVRIRAVIALANIRPERDPPVATLAEALRHEEPMVRRAAAVAVGRLGRRCRQALPDLIEALHDDEPEVRQVAAWALGEQRPSVLRPEPVGCKEVHVLAQALIGEKDQMTRHWAAMSLLQFGAETRTVTPALCQALDDPSVAYYAADILARFSPEAVPILTKALQGSHYCARIAAVEMLPDFGLSARSALPTLLGVLHDEDSSLRLRAAEAIVNIDRALARKVVVPVLLELLKEKDEDGAEPFRVYQLLAETGPEPAAVAALGAALIAFREEDDARSSNIRYVAARALAKAGRAARPVAPALMTALQDRNGTVRVWAALALWHSTQDTKALPVLAKALTEEGGYDREIAAEALVEIGPQAATALPAFHKFGQNRRATNAVDFGLAVGLMALSQDNFDTRVTDRQHKTQQLIGLVQHQNPQIRSQARTALKGLGREVRQAVIGFAKAMKQADARTRSHAVDGLGALVPIIPEAVTPLCWGLDDSDESVRLSAARAMCRLGRWHPRLLPTVVAALKKTPDLYDMEDFLPFLAVDAKNLLPPLVQGLRDQSRWTYLSVARNLKAVDPIAAAAWNVPDTAPARAMPWSNLSTSDLELLWKEFASTDLPQAYRAFWTLVLAQEPAVAFMNKQLQPAPRLDADRIAPLILSLGNDRFATRQKAAAELEQFLDSAAPALRKALEANPPLEVRRRIDQLLAKLDPANSPARQRDLRAVEALAEIGTPAAQQLLQGLAKGAPEARLTREAQASLRRLAGKGAYRPALLPKAGTGERGTTTRTSKITKTIRIRNRIKSTVTSTSRIGSESFSSSCS
jgi:HEAT repeat protein